MQTILTVNGGSSSLKCALFEQHQGSLRPIYTFKVGNILDQGVFKAFDQDNHLVAETLLEHSQIAQSERHLACLEHILSWLKSHLPESNLFAIGHRVVHGGSTFTQPCQLDAQVLSQLQALIPLAPLHQPFNLKLIEACQILAPNLPQIACFDTMFHSGQSALEQHYAIPRKYTDEGVHRYGFHGLSYEYIQRQLEQIAPQPLNTIVCHLGAGASMCAIKQGRSIASSMGFTAVDGLPMASRCGNIDPGVLLYLQRHHNFSVDDLEAFIYKQSGWLGVSGVSADMLALHQSDNPDADTAIEMFCYRAALEIGRLSASLEGLQQLVFTGGVGENDADVRARILTRCRWLGVEFAEHSNQQGEPLISSAASKVVVRVIPTNEEAMIAQHVAELV